jgi:hypothetical protein
MKNCLFCHRPISGDACRITWLFALPNRCLSPPYIDADGPVEYAHPECVEEAQKFMEWSVAS